LQRVSNGENGRTDWAGEVSLSIEAEQVSVEKSGTYISHGRQNDRKRDSTLADSHTQQDGTQFGVRRFSFAPLTGHLRPRAQYRGACDEDNY
jgi:hypothetical protein